MREKRRNNDYHNSNKKINVDKMQDTFKLVLARLKINYNELTHESTNVQE